MELCYVRISDGNLRCTGQTESKPTVLNHCASIGRRKTGNLKVLKCGFIGNWKKHRKNKVSFCVFVMGASCGMRVKEKPEKWFSSDKVIEVLKTMFDPDQALVFFKTAQQPNLVHTTESCNYMLEFLRIHGKMEEMAVMFDLMQKQIIKRNLETYLTIFEALYIRGGIQQAPCALEQMRKVGFFFNAFSYNGLIHLLLRSGFRREALVVYRRMV
uniref:Pentatricopeptide repeat-containing protein n=1 Tax=Nelumbo nucifera TaxID=4432 RepID=A0A822ZCK9_NELNU|nr:TPA_asm: hypothetical protein HUJ06_000503 [Nelumbo nucifera]